MEAPLIRIEDLYFSYNEYWILENISLEIYRNDFWAILGPNGGGKTTLLKLILGFLKPTKGKLLYQLKKGKIGYVPQYAIFDRNFPVTVWEVVLMAGLTALDFSPFYKKQNKEKALSLLQLLKVETLAKKRFGDLSGGQKQRVLIARSLMNDPQVLILDEPTASVDNFVEKDIYDLLHSLQKTIVLVTHDLGYVSTYVNKIGCLNRMINIHTNPADIEVTNAYHADVVGIHHSCGL